MILHAGCAALRLGGGWRGVLITGPSGAGKSDLLLRLLESGWRLVADDRTVVWPSSGRLWTRVPDTLTHLVEARGFGILGRPALPMAEAVAVLVCGEEGQRVPEPEVTDVAGLQLPLTRLHGLQASDPIKAREALHAALRRRPFDSDGCGRI